MKAEANFVYLPAISAFLFCLLCYVCDEWDKHKDEAVQAKSLLEHATAFLTPLLPLILIFFVIDVYWRLILASRRRQEQVSGGGDNVGEEGDKSRETHAVNKDKASSYLRNEEQSIESAQAS